MNKYLFALVLTTVACLVATFPAAADSASATGDAARGRGTYRNFCASCHGPEARGDGPVATYLDPKPSDLTQISARNNGEFPADQVSKIIDGRQNVKGHGSADMPTWGDAFRKLDQVQSDEDVARKIAELTAYLRSIQQTAKGQ